jgi:hypothetical protein
MYLKGRQQLLVSRARDFGQTHDGVWYAYWHAIRWQPAAGTRLILQRIVRNTKEIRTVAGREQRIDVGGGTAEYWELWEVFQGEVYPFNQRRGEAPFVPNARAPASYQLTFAVPAVVAAHVPFLTVIGTPGPAATAAQLMQGDHDRFTEQGVDRAQGVFKIYAEVYELNAAQCQAQRVWLNQFRVTRPVGGAFSAGNLPAKAGPDAARPLETPTLIRYEAGTFDRTGGHRLAAERDFPWTSGISRYSAAWASRVP